MPKNKEQQQQQRNTKILFVFYLEFHHYDKTPDKNNKVEKNVVLLIISEISDYGPWPGGFQVFGEVGSSEVGAYQRDYSPHGQ